MPQVLPLRLGTVPGLRADVVGLLGIEPVVFSTSGREQRGITQQLTGW